MSSRGIVHDASSGGVLMNMSGGSVVVHTEPSAPNLSIVAQGTALVFRQVD
jgi:hypothetical protein